LSFRSNPKNFILSIVAGLIHGGFYVLFTVGMQLFFDEVNKSSLNFKSSKYVYLSLISLGFILITREIFNGLHNFMGTVMRECSKGYNLGLIHKIVSKFQPIYFEDTNVLDEINRAKQGSEECFRFIDTFLDLFDFYLPYFIFMGIYLYTIDPILVFSILAIFIPTLINTFIRSGLFFELEKSISPLRRKLEAYRDCICDIKFYKETRLLNAYDFFIKKYADALEKHNEEVKKAEYKSGFVELGMKLITLIGYFIVLFLLINTLLNGKITAGEFSAIFSSLSIFFVMMEYAVYRNMGNAFKNVGAVKNFLFLLQKEQYDNTKEFNGPINSIKLNDISFSYDDERYVLKNISFDITCNKIIAIVGPNGAGKSTLAKILLGLYPVSKGEIFINNEPLHEFNKLSVLNENSAVFQDYQRYKMSLKDNIILSNFMKGEDDMMLDETIIDADIEMNDFNNDLNLVLSKDFDGIDISGGQWQRIAIARGLYKEHSLIVLDEPTSAIDPLEESRIYNNFKKISKNKISFLITHRIGAAKIADTIIVLDEGKIVEMGSHDELMKLNGKYKLMFDNQSKWY